MWTISLYSATDKRELWDGGAPSIDRLGAMRLTIHETEAQVTPADDRRALVGLRRLSRPSTAETAQRGELHAPAGAQPRPVPGRQDHVCRIRRQREGLDQPCPIRRYVGAERTHPGQPPHLRSARVFRGGGCAPTPSLPRFSAGMC